MLRTADTGSASQFPNEEAFIALAGHRSRTCGTVATKAQQHRRCRRISASIREFDPRRAFGDLFVSLLRRLT